MPEASMSEELLAQIDVFSSRVLKAAGLPESGSPNGGTAALRAMGLVLHYTASDSLPGAVRWLCDPRSNASSHYVVSEQRESSLDAHMDGLPLVAAMPATIVQLRPTSKRAYHATWANRWAIGIEMCNVGELRPSASKDHLWAPVAGVTWRKDQGVLQAGERRFAAFSDSQLQASVILCRALVKVFDLDPLRIVGHDMVQGTQTKVEGANGHDKRDVGGLCMRQWRALCTDDTWPPEGRISELLARSVDPALYTSPSESGQSGKARMNALGYAVDPAWPTWSPNERLSLGMFQVMMGLQADGICGPKTEAALRERVKDRFLAPTQGVAVA